LQFYIIIVLANLLTIFLSQSALINEIVFFNTYSEQLTYDRSMELFERLKMFSWVAYILIPIILLIKISSISLILYIGVFFCNLQERISLNSVFRVVAASEIIFVLAGLTKFLWFYFFAGNYTIIDLNFFYPGSLINLFNPSEVDGFWIFPLQTANLFQLAYVVLLSYGLIKAGNIEESYAVKIVITTYVPALILWILLVMFLSINAKI